MDWMSTLKLIATNATAQAGLSMTGLPDTARRVAGGNALVEGVVNGGGFALASDITDFFINGRSKVLNSQWLQLADESLYYGLLLMGLTTFDIDVMIANTVRQISPLSPNVNQHIVLGIIGTIFMTARDYVDMNFAGSNKGAFYLLHPTALVMQQ